MDAVKPVVKQQEEEDDDDDEDEGSIMKTLRCSPFVDSVIYQNIIGCLTCLLGQQFFGSEGNTDGYWNSILENELGLVNFLLENMKYWTFCAPINDEQCSTDKHVEFDNGGTAKINDKLQRNFLCSPELDHWKRVEKNLLSILWKIRSPLKKVRKSGLRETSVLKKMSGERVVLSTPRNESVNIDLEDRLSSLPEDLRKHILCMLPIQDAITTCILSKKWRYTYQSLPNLVFDSLQFVNGDSRLDHFTEFIDQTLLNHDDSDIETIKFKLLRERSHVPMTKWIDFAVKHNVQDLVIEAPAVEPGLFSSCVFSSTTLKRFTFSVNSHVLGRPTTINLPNLKELRLRGVIFTDGDLIENLFSLCSELEFVHLRHCDLSCLKILNISALRLKYLRLDYCSGLKTIEINLHTPSLTSFVSSGNLARNYNIRDGSSIRHAVIRVEISYRNEMSIDVLSSSAFKLLSQLCNVTMLAVDNLLCEFLFYKASDSWTYANAITFNNLIQLHLPVWPSKKHIQMLMVLLSRMPKVRHAHFLMIAEGQPSYLSTLKWSSKNLQTVGIPNSLEYIYINMFVGLEIELCLVKVLLENAKGLVKLTISTFWNCTEAVDRKKFLIMEKLLAFPRASTNAEVLLL